MNQNREEALMAESLSKVSELISDAINAIDEIIYNFNIIGNEYTAFQILSVFYEALDWIINVLQNAKHAFINDRINTDLERLIHKLNDILKCMENEDYIMLCDILEFEVAEILNQLKQAIGEE